MSLAVPTSTGRCIRPPRNADASGEQPPARRDGHSYGTRCRHTHPGFELLQFHLKQHRFWVDTVHQAGFKGRSPTAPVPAGDMTVGTVIYETELETDADTRKQRLGRH